MSDFMRDQTPLCLTCRTDPRPRDGAGSLLGAIRLTQCPEPRYAHFGICRARTHQVPKTGSIVALGASPCAEIAQSGIERNVRIAPDIPFFARYGRGGARHVLDLKFNEAEGYFEG